jgi:hypothetical protein
MCYGYLTKLVKQARIKAGFSSKICCTTPEYDDENGNKISTS